MGVVIELGVGTSDNGLALMLADLVRQNLEDKPHKQADFRKLRASIAIVAEDAGVALTLRFTGQKLVIENGVRGVPDVTVRATSDDIMNLSLVELEPKYALPDPRGDVMKAVFDAMKTGRVKVHGALPHVLTMLRLTRVMSVN